MVQDSKATSTVSDLLSNTVTNAWGKKKERLFDWWFEVSACGQLALLPLVRQHFLEDHVVKGVFPPFHGNQESTEKEGC